MELYTPEPEAERAGVDADEHELAHEGVVHDLERQRRERRLAVGRPRFHVARVGVHAGDGRDVERRRQIVDHAVEHRLHALVLERRAADHGEQLHRDGAGADRRLDLLGADLLLAEILLHQVLVHLGEPLDHLLPILLDLGEQIDRDLLGRERLAQAVVVAPDVGDLLDEVHDAAELVLTPDRDLDGHRMGAEPVLEHREAPVEVGADAVHLVHVDQTRHPVLVGLPPHRLRLRLHARHRVEDGDGAVEHAERPLDFHREVHVAGRVDDVDPAVVPEAGGRGGGDGDAALLLLDHPVHDRRPLVHLADLVGPAGVVEDPLGGGGLAGIDVRHDADVSGSVQRVLRFHSRFLSFDRRAATQEKRGARWEPPS